MNIDEIRARLTACPIPEDAEADWRGTNHYEIYTPVSWAGPYWWLLVGECACDSSTEDGKRLGAVLDYACAYRRDVGALLAEVARLSLERSAIYAALAKVVGEESIESHEDALEWLSSVAEVQRTQQTRIAKLEAENAKLKAVVREMTCYCPDTCPRCRALAATKEATDVE